MLIQFNQVSFRYPGMTARVLNDVSLTIGQGEFVAVLGHNGSGKSTLAKLCNAILLPESGVVTVDGLDTADPEQVLAIRQRVGMVFQNPDNQIVATLVEEDAAFALENLGVPSAEIRRRVDEALRAVGMYESREHAPYRLSGGQKQRVAIAGVLAMRPDCIVLDEPTAMLDPAGRREIMDTLRTLCQSFGTTIVLITHHMSEAAQADRVIVMAGGKILDDGTPRAIFSRVDMLREVGLSAPQTVSLLDALRQKGWGLSLGALSDEECALAIWEELHANTHSANPKA